jgi:pantoate--beta-alanine ligase
MREADGLALSSRNVYLDVAERRAATVLFRALSAAQAAYTAGERHAVQLRQVMADTLASEPLANMQYVSCADAETLQELAGLFSGRALLSMAVFIGKTRLIDNCILGG